MGIEGNKTLVCIGINPSTASPEKPDATIRKVSKIAEINGYDSWIMLNLYPQRATNPDLLNPTPDILLHQGNLRIIASVFAQNKPTVWAAWGNLIEKRAYMKECLKDIYFTTKNLNLKWKTLGETTKSGHPRHPLYLKYDTKFQDFNIEKYLNILTKTIDK